MAVSVTYYIRGGGIVINASTTPPTATQANQVMKQSAVCVFGIVDDIQALFTHNWGLDNSAGPFYEPEILVEPISTTTSWPLLTFWRVSSNVFSINKLVGDAATTAIVTLRKPHSIGM
jgi:hypothetical protein